MYLHKIGPPEKGLAGSAGVDGENKGCIGSETQTEKDQQEMRNGRLHMVASQNRGPQYRPQNTYSPYYRDSQKSKPRFGKAPYRALRGIVVWETEKLRS